MSYSDALSYIYSFTDYENRGFPIYAPEFYNLARFRHLLDLLGNPHNSFKAVHIAGTKGKGSTAAMIESVLRAAGHRTGLYTSPHLHTFRERIQACGQLIPEADVVRLVAQMESEVAEVPGVTTFEIMTALAFVWFAQQDIEWAVVEVGLGGRLDATNVLTPAVSVLTSISYDHMAILGDTLTLIAAEKAFIIKPGVPVVSAPQDGEALDVFQEVCLQQEAPLTLVGCDWTWQFEWATHLGQAFTVEGAGGRLEGLWIPLLGEYQIVNATTALATLSLLAESGANLPESAIRDGLRSVRWPGRLEILADAPLIVVDGAHNGDSARKLAAALREHFRFRHLIIVLGASADHATPALLDALLSGADRAIATRAPHPRAASPDWLQERAAELGYDLDVTESVAEALDSALATADTDDLICCTGSVFVAAAAREVWLERQGQPLPPSDPI
jgi:dihydrofolate synthase/folylpolyglutamate synthase